MADAVRLFVITWDPLAGRVERPSGFATTNGGSVDSCERINKAIANCPVPAGR